LCHLKTKSGVDFKDLKNKTGVRYEITFLMIHKNNRSGGCG